MQNDHTELPSLSPADDTCSLAQQRQTALEAINIVKNFGSLSVLRGVSISLFRGEITAVVGDNGAGKSTFMKVLCGEHIPDQGQLCINGKEVRLRSTQDAQHYGIETVYQDLALAPDLSVAENVFLGRELKAPGWRGTLGMLDRKTMLDSTTDTLSELGVKLKTYRATAQSLSGGQRQGVAIARAIKWARHAILLDEPTAALGSRQRDMVYLAIRAAAGRNLAVLLISHDLPQVLEIADRIVVMRQGVAIANLTPSQVTVRDIVDVMLGAKEAVI
ncbi:MULTISPECIES: ATP-binding cassette domain-containing protein [Brenneria]|uniref:Sugar ABC transporter ATP-binding protein n=1 Tax=Brenneria nigrifluens DSM 30175 = ATCC 13028 TaxID=1121120 RepID=A0A2U1UWR8_9GAMM|nr:MULTISPECIES: ATP-binding cassette domain-containing protein [Brenneria]EHD22567.1 Monosaccharide-transporting ATPase [Brenneria sp. EniD312]PWC26060.1 sugar ABC transporter ATP-binding protein [Brenneria nigrifluens DSM 30175 = ATCC 13028]QCR05556.1 sugar ABC transporter ATP-binding protein [Brenneria nigrifluens DSM 30175 = ATCC 13028]